MAKHTAPKAVSPSCETMRTICATRTAPAGVSRTKTPPYPPATASRGLGLVSSEFAESGEICVWRSRKLFSHSQDPQQTSRGADLALPRTAPLPVQPLLKDRQAPHSERPSNHIESLLAVLVLQRLQNLIDGEARCLLTRRIVLEGGEELPNLLLLALLGVALARGVVLELADPPVGRDRQRLDILQIERVVVRCGSEKALKTAARRRSNPPFQKKRPEVCPGYVE